MAINTLRCENYCSVSYSERTFRSPGGEKSGKLRLCAGGVQLLHQPRLASGSIVGVDDALAGRAIELAERFGHRVDAVFAGGRDRIERLGDRVLDAGPDRTV